MKVLIFILLTFLPAFAFVLPARAQEQEIEQLVLDIEKLSQLKQILQKMYDGYVILTQGYQKVKEITSGNFKLHEVFLDALMQVSPQVKKYGRIAEIIQFEISIVSEYRSTFNTLKNSHAFNIEQLDYMSSVYGKVLSKSLQGLDELLLIITSGQLRMSDDERLRAIDKVFDDMKDRLVFIRSFNRENKMNAVMRIKENTEINTIENLYNLK